MFKDIRYNEYSKEMMEKLEKGAFLTVKDGKYPNKVYHIMYYGEIVASYIKE